jgi:hypothetical protein
MTETGEMIVIGIEIVIGTESETETEKEKEKGVSVIETGIIVVGMIDATVIGISGNGHMKIVTDMADIAEISMNIWTR